MELLTRDAILKAEDLPYEDVAVPEWGGTVRVATLTGTAYDAWNEANTDEDGNRSLEDFSASLCALCIVGADGKPVFGENDVRRLGGKSCNALRRVFAVASRLNGLGTVRDAEKNSDGGQTSSSG